jgi:hypothetical protein
MSYQPLLEQESFSDELEYTALIEEDDVEQETDSLASSMLASRIVGIESPTPGPEIEANKTVARAKGLLSSDKSDAYADALSEALSLVGAVDDSKIKTKMEKPLKGIQGKIVDSMIAVSQQTSLLQTQISSDGSDKALKSATKKTESAIAKLAKAIQGSAKAIDKSLEASDSLIDSWQKKNQTKLFSTVHPKAALAIRALDVAGTVIGVVGNAVGTTIGIPVLGTGLKFITKGVSKLIEMKAKSEDSDSMEEYAPLLTPETGPSDLQTKAGYGMTAIGKAAGLLGADEDLVKAIGYTALPVDKLFEKLDKSRDKSTKKVDLTSVREGLQGLDI